jgi:capsular polysaccharide biosynthesis protein
MFEAITRTQWAVVHGMPSMIESAKFFNTALILFAVHGAGCVNLIYMQPGTVYLNIQPGYCNWAFWNLSTIAGLHHIATTLPGMSLTRGSTPEATRLDLKLAQRMLRVALMQLDGIEVSRGTAANDYIKLNV